MNIKDVKLRKGMVKDEVNELIGEWLTLEDDVYLVGDSDHNWKCKCGNVFNRRWFSIKHNNQINCGCVEYNQQEERYKYEVEKTGEYEYIRSYRRGDVLPNGKVVGDSPYIQIKHKYCGSIYEITSNSFINQYRRCVKCCSSYENSFAYYIEKILGEPIEKYWDFEKNTVNPYHISRNFSKSKIWIKCTEKDYHGSYQIRCDHFVRGVRCGYCNGKKVHPKDSFAQYHIDNTDKNFLVKYWSDKNTVDPFSIAPNSGKKIWIKCQEKDYHNDYNTTAIQFTRGDRCGYCNGKNVHSFDSFAQYCKDNIDENFLEKYWSSNNIINPWSIKPNAHNKIWIKCQCKDYHNEVGGYEIACYSFVQGVRCPYCFNRKVHPLDSFGYKHFDKVMSWHPDNKISPFRVSPNSGRKFKFACETCGHEWNSVLSAISKGSWCPQCNSSKGEKEITKWLRLNNIEFIPQKEFSGLVGIGRKNLSYDFYLPDYNLLIEYQGAFHDGTVTGSYRNLYDFDRQKEHDKRKREYAKKNNIELLEIWYWDFDSIDEILKDRLI